MKKKEIEAEMVVEAEARIVVRVKIFVKMRSVIEIRTGGLEGGAEMTAGMYIMSYI